MKDELIADFGIASLQVGAIAFVILILSGFWTTRCGATVYDSDGSEASVRALLNAAHDGDTITLPAGTFSWTAPLTVTKGITIRGQTTVSGAGTANATADDQTIVKDDITPRNARMIRTALNPGQSFRLTAITFAPGTTTVSGGSDGAILLRSEGASPNISVRLDHCHFSQIYQAHNIEVNGWTYGVADHNLIELRAPNVAFMMNEATYGQQINGNGAWADYPWYGTEKFFFIEDNTVKRINPQVARGLTDTSVAAGRWVIRHNYIQDCLIGNHGTEAQVPRGGRIYESYDNTFNFTLFSEAGDQRSGTSMWHDNRITGIEPGQLCRLANFREAPVKTHPVWGIADGTSPWDANDTEGNGTFIEGHPPYLFDSGTDTSSVNSEGVIHDSTKNWIPNQWIGYSIKSKNPSAPSYNIGSYVISNTSNTITYLYYSGADGYPFLKFSAGDTYEIHRVLAMMDQNGSGKGDLLTGSPNPINTRTGTASWAHSSREPCYSWNNVYTPNGHVYGFVANPAQPTTKINIDFFNLGGGFPAHTTPSAVSTKYVAALNGVDYTGTFVYPHPLVSGKPTAAQRDTKSQQPRWRKKEESKKAKKKRSWPKQVGE